MGDFKSRSRRAVICTVLPVSQAVNDCSLVLNSINSKRKWTHIWFFWGLFFVLCFCLFVLFRFIKHSAFLCIKARGSGEVFTLISISVRGIDVTWLTAYTAADIWKIHSSAQSTEKHRLIFLHAMTESNNSGGCSCMSLNNLSQGVTKGWDRMLSLKIKLK